MRIGVIGHGYVGRAVRVGFESKGHEVLVHDEYKKKISEPLPTVSSGEFTFICVPTPSNSAGGIDLQELDSVMAELDVIGPRGVVVIKSTVLPRTTQKYSNKYPALELAVNPEFLDSHNAVQDFLHPSSIIIGHTRNSVVSAVRLASLYREDGFGEATVVRSEVAEMTKYMVNAYYTTRVIFANEIYDICQRLGLDYGEVRRCFELDRRVEPGHFDVFHDNYRGFRSGCLPKDLSALISEAREIGVTPTLLQVVQGINKKLMKHGGGTQ